jgi:hypothetical protein
MKYGLRRRVTGVQFSKYKTGEFIHIRDMLAFVIHSLD